mgnify:CR=1 FL=1
MRYMEPNLQVQAGGNIRPIRIVKISTAADNTVLESASNTSVSANAHAMNPGRRTDYTRR